MRTQREYESATGLLALGLEVAEVAGATGVPLSTVGNWARCGPRCRRANPLASAWRPGDPAAYAYLLGAYLGDGCVVPHARGSSHDLRLYLDALHSGVVDEVFAAVETVFPGVPVRRFRRKARCEVVRTSHSSVRAAFPQHGRGKKHQRPIRLEPWQCEITAAHPRQLIRGLIHSDGCRCVNRFKTELPSGRVREYSYVRYFFSNLSEDIKDIFCSHCDMLGVRWSRANARYVSVHDRRSVAILDGFVGPKR